MTKLVVALDGSPRQAAVLARAVELAGKLEGRLTLLRVVTVPAELPSRAYAVRPEAVGDLLLEDARTELGELAKAVPPALLDEVRALLGTPWRTLVDAAEERHADLLIVGSHGYGGLDRLLGTTAAKVVDHARCSVLVAR